MEVLHVDKKILINYSFPVHIKNILFKIVTNANSITGKLRILPYHIIYYKTAFLTCFILIMSMLHVILKYSRLLKFESFTAVKTLHLGKSLQDKDLP